LEKAEIRSVLVVEPTLTADETHAGDASADVAPALPDATTVATADGSQVVDDRFVRFVRRTRRTAGSSQGSD
jgi:hypothetical protein